MRWSQNNADCMHAGTVQKDCGPPRQARHTPEEGHAHLCATVRTGLKRSLTAGRAQQWCQNRVSGCGFSYPAIACWRLVFSGLHAGDWRVAHPVVELGSSSPRISINEAGYDVDLPASCRDIASTQAAGPSQGPTCARKASTQPARPGKPFRLGRLFRCRQVSRVREDTACQCDQPAININAL